MMAVTARLNAKQPLKQRESSPAAGAKNKNSKSQSAGKGGTRASVMSLIAKTTISKNKKTRDVSNEGIRADVTSEVPVVKTRKSIPPVVEKMTWMREAPVVETTTWIGEEPVVEKMTWRSTIPVVETMTWKRKLPVAETTTRKEPAPSPKSSADVLGITASVSEQPATEAICGGNVVLLSMAN